MNTLIPNDLRTVGLGAIMIVVTSFACSFALDRYGGSIPFGFAIACFCFWAAIAGMSMSDHLDHRAVDQRTGLSFILNSVCIIVLPISFIAWFGMFFLWLCAQWNSVHG